MAEWDDGSPLPGPGPSSDSPSAPLYDSPPGGHPQAMLSPEPALPGHDPLRAEAPVTGGSVYTHWMHTGAHTPGPAGANLAPLDTPTPTSRANPGADDEMVMLDDRSYRPPTPGSGYMPISPTPGGAHAAAGYPASPSPFPGLTPPPNGQAQAYPPAVPQEAWPVRPLPQPAGAKAPAVARAASRGRAAGSGEQPAHQQAGMATTPPRAPVQAGDDKVRRERRAAREAEEERARRKRAAEKTLRIRKGEAWARMVAYESCWQVCLAAASASNSDADVFLVDSCKLLKRAFGLTAMTLAAAGEGGAPAERRPVVYEEDHREKMPVLAKVGEGSTRSSLRIQVLKLKDKRKKGGLFNWGLPKDDPDDENPADLHVVLRPRSRPESSSVTVRPAGAGGSSSLVLGGQEANEDLLLELWDGQEMMGKGTVPVAALWDSLEEVETILRDVHGDIDKLIAGQDLRERVRMMVAKLVRKAAGRQDPALLGAVKNGDGGAQHKLQVMSTDGTYMGKVIFGLWRDRESPASGGGSPKAREDPEAQLWNVGPCRAYDLALAAALRSLGCGPRKLQVTQPWDWLLGQFAETYGVSSHYCSLSHLKWAVDPDIATPTADCFAVLLPHLSAVRDAAAADALAPSEKEMFKLVGKTVERLIAKAFENYRLLNEAAPLGLGEPDGVVTTLPAPALKPAVDIFYLLRDASRSADQTWLKERLQTSARRRYMRLEYNSGHGLKGQKSPAPTEKRGNARGTPLRPKINALGAGREGLLVKEDSGDKGASGTETPVMLREFKQLEVLASAVTRELEGDVRVHQSKVLPPFVNLPALTAEEHCRELVTKIQAVLRYRAPPLPSPAAVRMLVAVGRLQHFLNRSKIMPPKSSPAHLEAPRLFQPHVLYWIAGSKAALVAACGAVESAAVSGQDQNAVLDGEANLGAYVGRFGKPACAVAEALGPYVEAELDKYRAVVETWPEFGPSLEATVCSVVRRALKLMGDNYGGVPTAIRKAQSKPIAKAAKGVKDVIKRGRKGKGGEEAEGPDSMPKLTLNEAKMLNSLKHLLQWAADIDRRLVDWCHGRPEGIGEQGEMDANGRPAVRPQLGQQLAQIKKELRMEYSAAVKNAVERLSWGLLSRRERSARLILKEAQEASALSEEEMGRALRPLLVAATDVLGVCEARVVDRAHVSVLRGVWDSVAKEVFEFTVDLTERERSSAAGVAWKGQRAAQTSLNIIDNHFKELVSKLHGDLSKGHQRDFDLPLHSDNCHKLLSDGSVLDSFTVF